MSERLTQQGDYPYPIGPYTVEESKYRSHLTDGIHEHIREGYNPNHIRSRFGGRVLSGVYGRYLEPYGLAERTTTVQDSFYDLDTHDFCRPLKPKKSIIGTLAPDMGVTVKTIGDGGVRDDSFIVYTHMLREAPDGYPVDISTVIRSAGTGVDLTTDELRALHDVVVSDENRVDN